MGASRHYHRYGSRLACSADWPRFRIGVSPNGIRQVGGLPIRDTADCQSALRWQCPDAPRYHPAISIRFPAAFKSIIFCALDFRRRDASTAGRLVDEDCEIFGRDNQPLPGYADGLTWPNHCHCITMHPQRTSPRGEYRQQVKQRVNDSVTLAVKYPHLRSLTVELMYFEHEELARAVAGRRTSLVGEACCQGWRSRETINAERCLNILRYKLSLKY